MFQVPDWENVPKNNTNLGKRICISSKTSTLPSSISHVKKKKQLKPTIPPPKKLKITNGKEKQASIYDIQSTAKKRKHNGATIKKEKDNEKIDVSNIDMDKIDEVLLNAKKKKFYEPLKEDDVEHLLFKEETKFTQPKIQSWNRRETTIKNDKKHKREKLKLEPEIPTKKVFQVKNEKSSDDSYNTINRGLINKKEKLKAMLQINSKRNSIKVRGNKLRERMLDRLKAAQFRYINEKLYTSSGSEAKELFQSDPVAFHTYHQGYQQQVKKWPVNPLDVIVQRIQKMSKSHTIVDMGCGEAALSKRVPHKVRSFDLVSTDPGVEICDMSHTPLPAASMDVAVYCLALMGTELTQYLVEANRVLKMGGHLLIAEVESRFTNVEEFAKEVTRLGFKLKKLDKQHQVFFFMEFVKIREPPAKKNKLPVLTLKPCLYKKR